MQVLERFKLIEQGIIRSTDDITRLNFIDFGRLNGHFQNNILSALRAASTLLVNTTAFTVAQTDLRAFPARSDWPGWTHAGNHESLGKLYWNFFFWGFQGRSPQLRFHDEPDFSGSFIDDTGVERWIYGDIGQVSASTFIVDTYKSMRGHDLWISVLDEHRQIILEPQIDIVDAYGDKLEEMFGIE